MNLLKYLKKKFHIHYFWHKIVASQYVSFNFRDIVGECRCGKRKIIKDVHHDIVFPFITNHITDKEMEQVANGKLNVKREFVKE